MVPTLLAGRCPSKRQSARDLALLPLVSISDHPSLVVVAALAMMTDIVTADAITAAVTMTVLGTTTTTVVLATMTAATTTAIATTVAESVLPSVETATLPDSKMEEIDTLPATTVIATKDGTPVAVRTALLSANPVSPANPAKTANGSEMTATATQLRLPTMATANANAMSTALN